MRITCRILPEVGVVWNVLEFTKSFFIRILFCILFKGKNMQPGVYPDQPPPYTGPPPSGPYAPPPQSYGPTVVQATVVPTVVPVVIGRQIGPSAARIRCRSCNIEIVTRVESRPTTRTHLFAALLCLLGLWPCVCLPYCMDSCNNADHYCPNCNAYIGSYVV